MNISTIHIPEAKAPSWRWQGPGRDEGGTGQTRAGLPALLLPAEPPGRVELSFWASVCHLQNGSAGTCLTGSSQASVRLSRGASLLRIGLATGLGARELGLPALLPRNKASPGG